MEREYILEEIRRTATVNAGRPLGSKRFANETGIREGEWAKFWVRWGDALVAAGFPPNDFVAAYPDDFLLERLADLALELGHFPLTREIKMKARSAPGFPSEQAFRRLGTKSVLATKLAVFCENHSELHPVASLCRPHMSNTPPAERAAASKPRITGEVYLVKAGRYYKIGKTNSVGRREYELALQLPEKPVPVHVIKTDDPSGIEAYWHRRFSNRRMNGEWFELTREDVAAFKWRKFM
jgi:hypothetical protein